MTKLVYRVIDTPHENTEQRFVGAEQLNFLMFNTEVFLFELAQPAGHLRQAGHDAPFLAPAADNFLKHHQHPARRSSTPHDDDEEEEEEEEETQGGKIPYAVVIAVNGRDFR